MKGKKQKKKKEREKGGQCQKQHRKRVTIFIFSFSQLIDYRALFAQIHFEKQKSLHLILTYYNRIAIMACCSSRLSHRTAPHRTNDINLGLIFCFTRSFVFLSLDSASMNDKASYKELVVGPTTVMC